MWSIGCILYEMCSLRPPFIAENFKELKANVLIGIFPPIPKFYSEELFFIIRKLLEQEPSKRPSCSKFEPRSYSDDQVNCLSTQLLFEEVKCSQENSRNPKSSETRWHAPSSWKRLKWRILKPWRNLFLPLNIWVISLCMSELTLRRKSTAQ